MHKEITYNGAAQKEYSNYRITGNRLTGEIFTVPRIPSYPIVTVQLELLIKIRECLACGSGV